MILSHERSHLPGGGGQDRRVWRVDLNSSRRVIRWFLLAVLLILILTGCSGRRLVASSWPGQVVDDHMVYVAFGQSFYAIDPERQRVEWQYPNSVDNKSQATYYGAPAVTDGLLVVGGYDNVLYGVDRETRTVVWTFNRASDRYIGSPMVYEGRVYAATGGNELFALSLEELDRLGAVEKADDARRLAEVAAVEWEFIADHGIWSAPLVTAEMLYVTSLDHHVYALEIDSGEVVWTKELPGAMAGCPVLSEDGKTLYVGNFDYHLYALRAANGEELWSIAGENWVWGTPVLADDKLFFADLDGYLYAVDSETGEILWQEKVADAIRGGPVFDPERGYLYVAGREESNPGGVGTRGVVLALETESLKKVWEQPTAEAVYTSPAFSGDMLLVTPAQGTVLLQVYGAETGVLQWEYVPPED
jgi:outer membrane protein assembly factor BamB